MYHFYTSILFIQITLRSIDKCLQKIILKYSTKISFILSMNGSVLKSEICRSCKFFMHDFRFSISDLMEKQGDVKCLTNYTTT